MILEANKDCLDRYTILGELNLHPIIGNHYPDKNGLLGSSFRPDRLKRDFTKYEDTRHSSGLVWPGLIGELCHLSPKNSTIALSNIEEISWSHLFSIDPYLPTTERCDEKYLYFPDGFRHPLWDESMPSFILTSYRNIYDTSGKILSSIAQYKFGEIEFCIFVPQANSFRALGRKTPIAFWLNDDLLSSFPSATVFIFQDMRTAFAIQDRLDKEIYDRREIIITATLGEDFSCYDWSLLSGHKPIYIPSLTVRSIDNINQFEYQCNRSGISEYAVSKNFLLKNYINNTNKPESFLENFIINNSIVIDNTASVALLLETIKSNCVSVKEYRNLYAKLGIFNNTVELSNDNKNKKISLVPPDPRLLPPVAHKLEDVTANHIFRPKNIVMIVGEKNSGKTLLGMLSSKSVLQIEDKIFPFNKISPTSLGNICLVDAETPFDELQDHLCTHGLDKYINNKLYIISRLDPDNALLPTYDITNPQVREILSAKMKELGCKLLILDNLTAMMGSKVDNATSAQAVLDWFEELQNQNICIVFVLHKPSVNTKTGSDRNRGSQLFRDRSRVIINLLSKKEILALKEEGKPILEKTLAEISKPSLTVGIEFSVCKTAPIIEGHTIWTKMPFENSFEPIGITDQAGDEVTWQNSAQTNSILEYVLTLYPQVKHDRIKSLPESKLKVIKALDSCAGEAKMQDIMDNIGTQKGLKEDTVRNILKELSQLELVENIGEKQSRRYKIFR